jgi:hypothetical protein
MVVGSGAGAGPAEPIKYDFGDISRWGAADAKQSPPAPGAIQKDSTAGTMEGMTNEQILAETNRVEQEMLKSTQRALQELNGAEQAGAAALEGLARQNEQLDNIVANLDKMRTDIAYSDAILQKIASPFAFLHMKKETQEFETVFGCAPHWSGPLLKKGNMLTGFKTRYFVLVYSRLIYFNSEKNVYKGDLRSPRGEMNIKGAKVETNRNKLEITLRNGSSEKWQMRCESQNDFAGWVTMLERHAAGKFTTEKRTNDDAPTGFAATVQGTTDQMKKNLFAQQDQSAAQAKTVDEQVDDNLDMMMQKLDLLGGMACEQKTAIDAQNAKLDVISDTMEKTDQDVASLKLKHKKRLKDE